jgi:hypothetical protein
MLDFIMTASGWTNRCPKKPGAAQYVQAANSGFGASFMRGFGGALGQGLGGLATGGIGGAASALGGMMNRSGSNLMQGNFGNMNRAATDIWTGYTPTMGT